MIKNVEKDEWNYSFHFNNLELLFNFFKRVNFNTFIARCHRAKNELSIRLHSALIMFPSQERILNNELVVGLPFGSWRTQPRMKLFFCCTFSLRPPTARTDRSLSPTITTNAARFCLLYSAGGGSQTAAFSYRFNCGCRSLCGCFYY